MDKKRFIIALVVVGGALAAYFLYAMPEGPPKPPADTQPAEQPAPAPASQAASVPAAKTPTPPAPAAPKPAPAAPAAPKPAPAAPAAPPVTTTSAPAGPKLSWQLPNDPAQNNIVIGSNSQTGDSKYLLQVQLSTRGAGVQTVKLSDHFSTVDDRMLFDDCDGDPVRYLAKAAENPKKYQGFYSIINPVYTATATQTDAQDRSVKVVSHPKLAMATRWLHVGYKDGSIPPMPAKPVQVADHTVIRSADWLAGRHWRVDEASRTDSSVTFVTEVALSTQKYPAAAQDNRVRILKTYSVKKDDYTIYVTLKVESLFDRQVLISFDQAGPHGVPREALSTEPTDDRAVAYLQRSSDEKDQPELFRKSVATTLLHPEAASPNLAVMDLPQRVATTQGGTEWLATINQYFGAILHPVIDSREPWKANFYCSRALEPKVSAVFSTGMIVDSVELAPGASREFSFEVFAGPKKRDMFVDPDAPYFRQRYLDANYISTLDFRECFCSFNWLALAMMWMLQKLSIITFGNYGVGLMILVVLVRIVLHPLTRKGQMSMMKMQKLSPQIAKLKEKYKDDKDTLQKETMKFYKEQGASPLLGCLPMLLQMPIWIALWTTLQASVELRHAAFLPFWLTDLAAPDKLFSWTTPMPLTGWTDFNLLPLLLTVAMFLQTKFNPQASGPAATEQQQQQQKMMKWMMPIMMLWIFYPRPSGLCLYIMTSTFAGVGEQFLIKRHIQKKEELAEAMETTIDAPGKSMRGKRPKKAKGPFWTKGA